jgi:hypothetical protein
MHLRRVHQYLRFSCGTIIMFKSYFFPEPLSWKGLVSFHVLFCSWPGKGLPFVRVIILRPFQLGRDVPIRDLKSYTQDMMSVGYFR